MTYLIISNDTVILEKIHNFFPNFYTEENNFKIYTYEKNKFYVPNIPKSNYDKFLFYKKIYQIKNIVFSKIIFLSSIELDFNVKIFLNNLSRKIVKEQSDIIVFSAINFILHQDKNQINNIGYKMLFPKAYWNYSSSNVLYVVDKKVNLFEPFYFINYIDNFKIKNILKKLNVSNPFCYENVDKNIKNKLSSNYEKTNDLDNIDNNNIDNNNKFNKSDRLNKKNELENYNKTDDFICSNIKKENKQNNKFINDIDVKNIFYIDDSDEDDNNSYSESTSSGVSFGLNEPNSIELKNIKHL